MSTDPPGGPEQKGRTDNFGNLIANPLTDLIDVAGEKPFTPERLRFFKDGSRVFLQYGTDSTYSETDAGHLLTPGADQYLEVRTAERVSYPVGFDLIPSMSWEINQLPQPGDVVGGGYGILDLSNFDPATETYSGTDADGYFWYITNSTGLDSVLLAAVRNGTIVYKTTKPLPKSADVWTIFAQWVNWYDVGPGKFYMRYTDIENYPTEPQRNEFVGAVANDDGKASAIGSHRLRMGVYQASGNSGLTAEVGSMGTAVPGRFDYIFKTKSHTQTFNVTNTTDGTYEVVGGIRADPGRPTIKAILSATRVSDRPSSTAEPEVMVVAIDPSSTSLTDGDFSTPQEHNPKNSVIEEAIDNTATGPDFNAAGTDSTGAATAETMTDPGGYQIGRAKVGNIEGQGNASESSESTIESDRVLVDGDWALVLIDSNETGEHDVDFLTIQNS